MAATKKKTHIWVKQIRSSTKRPPKQELMMKGLGLGRVGRERLLQDTPAIRGMIVKVQHLIEVEVREGEVR